MLSSPKCQVKIVQLTPRTSKCIIRHLLSLDVQQLSQIFFAMPGCMDEVWFDHSLFPWFTITFNRLDLSAVLYEAGTFSQLVHEFQPDLSQRQLFRNCENYSEFLKALLYQSRLNKLRLLL